MTAAVTKRLEALEAPTNARQCAIRAAVALVLTRRGSRSLSAERRAAIDCGRASTALAPDTRAIDVADAEWIADHALAIADAVVADPAVQP